MEAIKDHPIIESMEKYGEPKSKRYPDEFVEVFGRLESNKLFEDLEDDLRWDIRKYKGKIEYYEQHDSCYGLKLGAEETLDLLNEYLEVVGEMKKQAV